MEVGQTGPHGETVRRNATGESGVAAENVTTPPLNMEGGTAVGDQLGDRNATLILVLVS